MKIMVIDKWIFLKGEDLLCARVCGAEGEKKETPARSQHVSGNNKQAKGARTAFCAVWFFHEGR